jgi:hypothetical protein
MNRRNFVRSAVLTGASLPLKASLMDNHHSTNKQWYELRTWSFADDTQRQLTASYLEQALIPALNRAGCANIGVFTESQPESPIAKTYLLIPFNTIEVFTAINEKLNNDKTYLQSAQSYLNGLILPEAAATAPAYQRIERSLLKAFAHMPQMDIPAQKPRLFELRRYESPTEAAGQKKIEMFNDAGEIDIFKRVGARPVFFGETLIGQYRPNLTYMLTFDDMADHDARWKAFGSDPDWKIISKKPEYSDARLISRITRTFLTPTSFSQI